MGSSLFSIGASALNAASLQLQTAGNNIANVNTPGYSVENVQQTEVLGVALGNSYLGNGVEVSGVTRQVSPYLQAATNQATAGSAAADQHAQDLSQIDSLFSNSTSGVGAAVSSFFASIQTLSQNPSNGASRQAMLSSAQQLAQSFNSAGDALQQMQASSTQAIQSAVGTVNQLATQIASLNNQISIAGGSGAAPNQLLDQRDQLVSQLNQTIQVSEVTESNGSQDLFLGNGQPLVVGTTASTLAVGQDPSNPQNITLEIQSQSGAKIPIQSNEIGGGQIGAMLQFNLDDIPSVENQLGLLATSVASAVNQQQALGTDLNGNAGAAIFSTPSPTVVQANSNTGSATVSASFTNASQLQASDYTLSFDNNAWTVTRQSDGTTTTSASMPISVDGMSLGVSGTPSNGDMFTIEPVQQAATAIGVTMTNPSQIAAASPVTATIGSQNTGSVAISSINAVGPTRNANLTQAATINFTGPTSYTVTTGGTTSAAQTYTAGQPITVNGWSMLTSGSPAAGDSISVGATVAGSSDGNNAIAIAQMQNQAMVNGGTLSTGYAALVANVGGMASNANTQQTTMTSALSAAQSAQSAVSGVNLDDEATKLIQYQEQYQAAAQVISTANTLFQSILNLSSTG